MDSSAAENSQSGQSAIRGITAQEGVTMNRLTEWIGEGEDRHAIPRMDLRKNGHQKCCNKLAEYEDLEEAGIIQKWIPVKWHVILDTEREEEGIPEDIVYYLDYPMPEDGEEIIVTDGKEYGPMKTALTL